jgi:hypothetical protein
MNLRLKLKTLSIAVLLPVVALVQGCALFVSHYDAGAYQQFTALKAYHAKFLEDFKAGNSRSYSEAKASDACSTGDLKFREAREYAAGKKDDTRVKAVQYLANVFARDCRLLLSDKKLFGEVYVTEQSSEIAKNYDLAIAGEIDRVGGKPN